MSAKNYLLTALGGVFLVGCGAPPVTQELKSARDAVTAAEASVASELAPAEVATAKQALDRAESAFKEDDKSQETIDYSYIAERSAQIAIATGQIEKAKRDRKEFKDKLEKLEKMRANMTQEQLDFARQALAEKKRELDAQREDLADTSQELEKERELRKAAEGKLTAALASLHEIGQVKEESRGVVITLSGSVLFATGKYELLPIAKDKLNDVAKALQDQGYKRIVVEGHTDSRGSDATNKDLSLSRAQSVRQHLVSQGIDAAKIEAVGLGESRPVALNDTAENRANNRRVELIVTAE
jgi:outer membrane protein OmpA-like peptidoglycan-associated protein